MLGRPTHRIAAALAHDGLDLADGTLAGVLAACSDLLAPLAAKITERNAEAAHLHVDETRWQVYATVEGKDSHRWWLWVFAGPDTTVFTIAPSRSLKVLTTQLGVQVIRTPAHCPTRCPAGGGCCCPRTSTPSTNRWAAWTESTTSGAGATSAATSSALATPTPTCRRGPRPGWSGSARSTAPTPR